MNIELIKSAASRYLGRGIYHLIEFRHSNFSQEWNFVNAGMTKELTVDGVTYESLPFALTLAAQGDNAGTTIAISNIDRRLTEELAKAVDNEDITVNTYLCHIEKVGSEVVAERYHKGLFTVTSVEVTQDVISLGVAIKSSLGFNVSSLRFNSNDFPNLVL